MLFALTFPNTSAHLKVKISNRVLAKVIDIFITILVAGTLFYPFGPLIAFFYSIFGDGMNFGPFRGQSVGKRILHLQVINQETKKPASLKESALRNAPVGVATFFAIIPIWGWIILAIIGVPLMAMEIYLMATVETGHRLGDVMGDTEVVEYTGI